MASVQGDSGVTDFGVISSRPGFMLHAEIQGKQVLVPVSGLAEGLGDKFAPLLGEGWAEKGQFAFGPGSKAQFTKENPPVEEEQVEPVLFSATATAEGVTQELEDIPCLIIDPSQGATASVTYAGQTYEIPNVPEGTDSPYVVAYIFPKSGEHPDQVVPAVGTTWYTGLFKVFEVTEVSGGWLTMSSNVSEVSGLPPVFPFSDMPGMVLIPVTDPDIAGVSYALGRRSTASGFGSIAMGDQSTASGDYSVATGYRSVASGGCSFAFGNQSTASGGHSFAFGNQSTASGGHSTAIGYNLIASGVFSTALGRMNVEDPTKILIIGNGEYTRKNIFTIDYEGKPDSAKIPSVNGGDLVVLGIVPPAAKPAFAGQIYLDANNKKLYVAKAATATTDWVAIN